MAIGSQRHRTHAVSLKALGWHEYMNTCINGEEWFIRDFSGVGVGDPWRGACLTAPLASVTGGGDRRRSALRQQPCWRVVKIFEGLMCVIKIDSKKREKLVQ